MKKGRRGGVGTASSGIAGGARATRQGVRRRYRQMVVEEAERQEAAKTLRTLDDMSPEEIEALEKQYGAKVSI